MNITYYLEMISDGAGDDEVREYRLYAVIDEIYFWVMEWKMLTAPAKAEIINFNSGFMSATVKEATEQMNVVDSAELRILFGSFADYIERAVSGFRSYISWITPDAEVNTVAWRIQGKVSS